MFRKCNCCVEQIEMSTLDATPGVGTEIPERNATTENMWCPNSNCLLFFKMLIAENVQKLSGVGGERLTEFNCETTKLKLDANNNDAFSPTSTFDHFNFEFSKMRPYLTYLRQTLRHAPRGMQKNKHAATTCNNVSWPRKGKAKQHAIGTWNV